VFYNEIKQKTEELKADPGTEMICIDFQQNLPVPLIPSKDLFYMRQILVYPFCIYVGRRGKVSFILMMKPVGENRKMKSLPVFIRFSVHVSLYNSL